MTALPVVEISIIQLTSVYKRALALHGGVQGEVVSSLSNVIKQLEGLADLHKDDLNKMNMNF